MSINNVNNQNVQNQQLSLEAFESMAGSQKSTGYLGLDTKGNLTKVAAHRTLTSYNKAELEKLQKDPLDNKYIRTSLFNAVNARLNPTLVSNDRRLAALNFVAEKLGINFDIDKNGVVTIKGLSDQPLERRLVRTILSVAKNPALQSILVQDKSDIKHTDYSAKRRDELIGTLKKNFYGIDWKQVPLGQLSNESLRKIGERILRGELRTRAELKDFVDDMVEIDTRGKINDEGVLLRLERAKTHPTDKVTFAPPKQLEGTEEKTIYKQSEADATRFLPKEPKPVDKDLLDENGNPLAREQCHKVLEDRLGIPSEATVDKSWTSAGEGSDISKIIKGQKGEAEMVVSHFLESFITTAADPQADMQAMLLGHKRALAVLIGCPREKFDAIFESIPNGSLFKESFESMRQTGLQKVSKGLEALNIHKDADQLSKEGLSELYLGKLVDEMRTQIRDSWNEEEGIGESVEQAAEKIRDELNTPGLYVVNTLVANKEEADVAIAEMRQDILNAFKNPGKPEDAIRSLLTTLANKHTETLALLLCHTDSMLGSLGNETLLKPVFGGLKAKLNEAIKAEMVKNGDVNENAKIDFFQPEFAGRISKEISQKIGALLRDKNLFSGIPDSVLTDKQVASLVFTAIEQVFSTLTSVSDNKLAETMQAIHDVKEQDVRNVLADFVLETETWVSDEEKVPGTRLQQMFQKDLDTLAVILCNPEKCAKTMGLPDGVENIINALKDGLKPLDTLFAPGNEAMARVALGKIAQTLTIEQFATMQQGIDKATDAALSTIQTLMGGAFEALLKGEDVGDFAEILDTAKEDQAYADKCRQAGMSEQQIEEYMQVRREERSVDKQFQKSIEGQDLSSEEIETRREAFYADKAAQRDHETKLKTLQGEALRTYVRDRKQAGEAEFNEKLGQMKLKEGFDAWAKRECYDKPSRAKLWERFSATQNTDNTIAAVCGGQTFTEFMTAFIADNNLRLKQFKEPDTMTEQERAVWMLEEAELKDIAGKGALDTTSGYGKFMVDVMKSYFSKVSTLDKKSMLASFLRQGHTVDAPKDATTEQIEQNDKDNLARQLGALFKGAGPVMQKLLQQLGSTDISKEFKLALDDMKMNLLPIPKEVVAVQLQSIIDAYNDPKHLENPKDPQHPLPAMTGIHVDKSLGAASVGQTLLCTVKFADNSERKVAIKLLRPDAQNRIDREKEIFLDVAKTIPGMERTYLGRLERVMEEVDLTIEANNVQKGQVYDASLKQKKKVYTDVKSMKLDPTIPSTRDIMVLECAPGVTVAELLQTNDAKLQSILSKADQFHMASVDSELIDELDTMIDELDAKQQQLSRLSFKWVEEALFKSGFYHGDLHAGNIMVDRPKPGEADKGLTVIDFGNATALSKDERGCIMRMVHGADTGNARLFLDNYRTLLKPESQQAFDDVRQQAEERLAAIFKKGDTQQIGQRILGAVTEMQKLNVELPAQIFNFSQCQILLQGTLEQVNTQLKALQDTRQRLYLDCQVGTEDTVYESLSFVDVIKKNLRTPEQQQQLCQVLDRRSAQYAQAIVDFFAKDTDAQTRYRETFGDTPLTVKSFSDPQVRRQIGEILTAMRSTLEGAERPDTVQIGEVQSLQKYLNGVNLWQTERDQISQLATVAALRDELDVAKMKTDPAFERLQEVRILLQNVDRLPEHTVIPPSPLSLDDADIQKLLGDKKTKADMMKALDGEIQRLKNDKGDNEEWFAKVKTFRDNLAGMPDDYVPRRTLKHAQEVIYGIPNSSQYPVNSKKDVLQKILSMRDSTNQELQKLRTKSTFNISTQNNLKAVNLAIAAFNTQHEGKNQGLTVTYKPSELIKEIYRIQNPKDQNGFPETTTLGELKHQLNIMKNQIEGVIEQQAKLNKTLELQNKAIDELQNQAKDWPDDTPIMPTPKVSKEFVEMLQGKPMSKENLLEALQPVLESREKIHEQLSKHMKALQDVVSEHKDDDGRLFDIAQAFTDADESFDRGKLAAKPQKSPDDFLDVMGNVVNDHKITAALSVGLGTAIKVLFS